MKYNGIELEPITEIQIFNPPKKMLVWDSTNRKPLIERVTAITMRNHYQVITLASCYEYCAEIPEEPKQKRATCLQLAEWMAKGNGMWRRECPYCQQGKEIPNQYGTEQDFRIEKDEPEVGSYGLTYVIEDDVCGCMQINYCPMCGRKLGG